MKMKMSLIKCLVVTALFIYFDSSAQQLIPAQARHRHVVTGNTIAKAQTTPTYDIRVLGIGGATDLAEAQKLGGNLSLGAYFQMNYENFRHAIYLAYNARPGSTSDTSVLSRNYLFPDIGKRPLTFGYEIIIGADESFFTFVPYTEFSLNRLRDSTFDFNTFNFSIGGRFNFDVPFKMGETVKYFSLSAQPYYQTISVDPKDFQTRNQVFGDILPPTIHTGGIYFKLQAAELALFANYKRILSYSKNFTNNDFRDGSLVIGALIGTDIFNITQQ